jgi:hypothetical protein
VGAAQRTLPTHFSWGVDSDHRIANALCLSRRLKNFGVEDAHGGTVRGSSGAQSRDSSSRMRYHVDQTRRSHPRSYHILFGTSCKEQVLDLQLKRRAVGDLDRRDLQCRRSRPDADATRSIQTLTDVEDAGGYRTCDARRYRRCSDTVFQNSFVSQYNDIPAWLGHVHDSMHPSGRFLFCTAMIRRGALTRSRRALPLL